jgi:DNA-binding beta-propeller fold protein YncE
MKTKSIMKNDRWRVCWMMLALIALCFTSCKDNDGDKKEATPFDPSKPVQITDFLPKEGGAGQRLVIYGKNFGNDPDIISVFIGGKKAVVISAEGESLYCLVPGKAYKGNIEVRVGDKNPVIGVAEELFGYKRKMIVSTVVGYKNERGDEGWKDGKFKDKDENKMASGFWDPSHMCFDPVNPKHLWATYDGNNGLYLFNFEDSTVTKQPRTFDRPRSVGFTIDGQYMIVSEDRGNEDDPSTYISPRSRNFDAWTVLTRYRQCNGAAIHPVNGEMYFNSYEKGQFFRFDMEKYFSQGLDPQGYEQLFYVHDPQWEYKIIIHPTGNYAYIVVINQHYILRVDYNWERKQFNQPYLVCGQLRAEGWGDGVGANARLRNPYQGVFVKNPEYAGKPDEYDFYFTEQHNHDIRKLTPEGSVTTFAGRGSSSINPDPWGYVDGDLRLEARFDQPTGIAYSEEEGAFYIGDKSNHRIRKIALEALDDEE